MRRLIACCFALLMTAAPGPAVALDPIALIVLRMVRDHLITSGLEAALAPDAQGRGERPAAEHLPTADNPRELRALIDGSFPQLTTAQRAEVHARLQEALSDPEHAASRGLILQQFIVTATASRQAHEAFSGLTAEQKRTIAVQAAETYRTRPAEDLQQLVEVLRSSAVPIPRDLRDLMLAELDADPARPRSQ